METSPLAIALISILGTVLVFMISLLITMVFGLKRDMETKINRIYIEIKEMNKRLAEMLPIDEYKSDKEKIDIKLNRQGTKILRLEIKVLGNGVEGDE